MIDFILVFESYYDKINVNFFLDFILYLCHCFITILNIN